MAMVRSRDVLNHDHAHSTSLSRLAMSMRASDGNKINDYNTNTPLFLSRSLMMAPTILVFVLNSLNNDDNDHGVEAKKEERRRRAA